MQSGAHGVVAGSRTRGVGELVDGAQGQRRARRVSLDALENGLHLLVEDEEGGRVLGIHVVTNDGGELLAGNANAAVHVHAARVVQHKANVLWLGNRKGPLCRVGQVAIAQLREALAAVPHAVIQHLIMRREDKDMGGQELPQKAVARGEAATLLSASGPAVEVSMLLIATNAPP